MAQGQYCIVDVTIDPNLAMEGHTGLTLEAATEWIEANQIALETECIVGEQSFYQKYLIQPDSWPESTEE